MRRSTLLVILTLFLVLAVAPLYYALALTPAEPTPAVLEAPALVETAPLPAPAVSEAQPAASVGVVVSISDAEPAAVVARPAVQEPTIWISPEQGEADTNVVVEGAGFPPELLLAIYVGVPNAGYGPDTLVTFVSDDEGAFAVDFTLPATWPDGRPITQPQLIIITSTEDGRVKALAPLAYAVRLDGRGELAVR